MNFGISMIFKFSHFQNVIYALCVLYIIYIYKTASEELDTARRRLTDVKNELWFLKTALPLFFISLSPVFFFKYGGESIRVNLRESCILLGGGGQQGDRQCIRVVLYSSFFVLFSPQFHVLLAFDENSKICLLFFSLSLQFFFFLENLLFFQWLFLTC